MEGAGIHPTLPETKYRPHLCESVIKAGVIRSRYHRSDMGYECPVCSDPQADARHLANHMAFTALLGDETHEQWLDDTAPGWETDGDTELAERLRDKAPEVEYPQVFEDTSGEMPPTDSTGESNGLSDRTVAEIPKPVSPRETAEADTDEVGRIVAEARELTQRMENKLADADREDDEE